MPISNPEVEAGDKTDGIIGYKKRRVSLKQHLAGVFRRFQGSRTKIEIGTSKRAWPELNYSMNGRKREAFDV